MRLILLLLLIQIAFTHSSAQLTIQHCQERARANHPLIQQYDLITKSAEFTISNANKAYLPQVSVTGIGGYLISGLPTPPGVETDASDKVKAIGVGQVSQVLWDGGTTSAQKEVIAANAEVEKAKVDVDLHGVRERVNQLFFGILVTDAQLAQLDLAGDALQRNLKKLSLAKDNGLALITDVDEVNAQLLKLEQRKIEYTYVRSGYVDMLALMIGEPLAKDVVLERPVATMDYASAPNQRPELGLFAHQRKLVEANYGLERTALMPKIGLLGAGVFIAPATDLGASKLSSLAIAGLSLSWNTAGLYRNGNQRNLQEVRLAQVATQEQTFLFNHDLQLHQHDSEIEKWRAIVAKDEEIVALKKKIKDAYQLKYDNGLCPMNDLISAIQEESQAQSDRSLHEIQLVLSIHQHLTDNGN